MIISLDSNNVIMFANHIMLRCRFEFEAVIVVCVECFPLREQDMGGRSHQKNLLDRNDRTKTRKIEKTIQEMILFRFLWTDKARHDSGTHEDCDT